MFFMKEGSRARIEKNVDEFGDSFARDLTVAELKTVRLEGSIGCLS
jgi:hypothetical protein